jgi:2-keto-4-pentenoate hydratase/2-oxohepta-3-ene-1,7-dioic acid hydratase in catechol pathway
MRFVRLDFDGRARWGIARDDAVQVLDGDPFAGYRESGQVVELASAALLPPTAPSKIMCLGKNYAAHRAEMGFTTPDRPSIFMKPPTTLLVPGGTVILPPPFLSTHVEHEAELAVVIGRPARFVPEKGAMDYVLGYTCADDVSARDLQRADPHPTRGKGFDTFCPLGPWIETDLDLSRGVSVRCWVNDELRQDGTTLDMTHTVPFLISFISQYATLLPGDLLLTGSPGGTGPLVAGDRVAIEVGGVGILRHGVAESNHVEPSRAGADAESAA